MNMKSCICGKPQPFAKCCDRFLSYNQTARTPEQLMRSRFSAYALGGYGEYLISTWLPASAKGLSILDLSPQGHQPMISATKSRQSPGKKLSKSVSTSRFPALVVSAFSGWACCCLAIPPARKSAWLLWLSAPWVCWVR